MEAALRTTTAYLYKVPELLEEVTITRPPVVLVTAPHTTMRRLLTEVTMEEQEKKSLVEISGNDRYLPLARIVVANEGRARELTETMNKWIIGSKALGVVAPRQAEEPGPQLRVKPILRAGNWTTEKEGWPARLYEAMAEQELIQEGGASLRMDGPIPWLTVRVRPGKWLEALRWAATNGIATTYDTAPELWHLLVPTHEDECSAYEASRRRGKHWPRRRRAGAARRGFCWMGRNTSEHRSKQDPVGDRL